MSIFQSVGIKDGANLDSFSRLRVSQATGLFDAQFTYDLQPLLFEQLSGANGGGTATISHDTTNRCALMTFTSVSSGASAIMQSYEHFRYTAGKAQLIFITFNMNSGVANTTKFAGYSDGVNGVRFQMLGVNPQFVLLTSTTAGSQTASLTAANLDKLDGTGPSKKIIDFSKVQILVIDLQALYVGRVRIGFDIDGTICYAHEFDNANNLTYPYIATANLPVRVGMTTSTTGVSTSMWFICSTVISEGGITDNEGFQFAQSVSGTAGNGAFAHILSLQPKTTFNSIANRSKFTFLGLSIVVTGSNPIQWQLLLGQAISGTTTFNDVNGTYSSVEYNSAGTLSGSPSIVLAAGFVAAAANAKESKDVGVNFKYPITLDAAGAVRLLGRLSFQASGIGGTSITWVTLNWKEIR